MKSIKKATLSVKAGVKAGALNPNHSRPGIRIVSGLKAGAAILLSNHSVRLLAAR